MHNLDRALKEYRNNELIADFKSQFSEPVMITSLEVYERFASCYFTRNIFKEIRNEIQRAGALNIKVLSTTLDKVEFSVTALGDSAKDRRVEVDRGKNLFSCSCKMFESRGIPCSHVFYAMKFENILEFPDSLIYKRWTKNEKNEFISTEMPVNDDVERVLKFRVGALASNCNKLCDIACKDLADFDEVQYELVNLILRLQSRKQVKESQQDKGHSFTNYECTVDDVMDEKCDTPHVQIDVRDPFPSSMPCGNKQGSYMALFTSMHRTL
ncbi:hypothetical protein AHAS_Ahas17G0143000 [Arachis hypogaea]